MAGGGFAKPVMHNGSYLEGRALVLPISLIISLFFLWGFSYGLLDVLNAHFQTVLDITKLESTGLQVAYFGGGYFLFSPVAGEVMKRFGYKRAINMGLTFYSLGAIIFWPVAHFTSADNKKKSFGGFVGATFVIACGLATLEVAANSYATVIGNPRTAARRLQFCQAWNGVASFIGPLIASKAFFSGENQNSLKSLQFVYLAVSLAGLAVNIMFFIVKMPEVSEEVLEAMRKAEEDAGGAGAQKPLWQQWNCIFGFVAQFCYVGSQVTVASFFINYCFENGGITKSKASFLLSMSLLIFTIARFVGTALLTIVASDFLMVCYSGACIAIGVGCVLAKGMPAVGLVMSIFFFESIQYPIIFVIGTEKLGKHTRRGSALLVMGVAGGAAFPPLQGVVADAVSTRISYIVPTAGFGPVFAYMLVHWLRNGRHIKKPVEVISVGADEEYAPGATIQTNAFGGIRINEISTVRTRESKIGDDHGLQKIATRDGPNKPTTSLFKVRTVDRTETVPELHSLPRTGRQASIHEDDDNKF